MDLRHPADWRARALHHGVDAATCVAAEWVRMKCLFGCDEPGVHRTCEEAPSADSHADLRALVSPATNHQGVAAVTTMSAIIVMETLAAPAAGAVGC